MRYSRLFGKTQREIPSDAETISHQLLLRSGMIAQLTAGVYSFMPLAWRSIQKIENIIRQEMNKQAVRNWPCRYFSRWKYGSRADVKPPSGRPFSI
ncbi:proline--tRNA ligase [Dehalococcoides mccartyi]|uniref:Proline--tRNA ligase n=1 Tax=Dehalococcoides mccartyi TaxID=61435 RepID=A0A2J1DVN2_9CHLR|nr:proline--tRNA ligase [Dehalococcoides mccartyi]